LILNSFSCSHEIGTEIKSQRDKLELAQLEEFKNKDLELIRVKDKLFHAFSNFFNFKLRLEVRRQEANEKTWSRFINSLLPEQTDILSTLGKGLISSTFAVSPSLLAFLKAFYTDAVPSTYETCILAAAEEEWAQFLAKLDEGQISINKAEEECQTLFNQLWSDFEKGKLIKNPYYHISIANDILADEWAKVIRSYNTKKIKKAMSHYKKAFKEDGKCPGAAHVGVAWCLLLIQKGIDKDYKEKSLKSLKSAMECLTQEMSVLNGCRQILLGSQNGFEGSDLDKQLDTKSTILGSYVNGVNGCIEAIKMSKRLIDLVKTEKKNDDQSRTLFEHLFEQEKDKIDLDDDNAENLLYSVTFNHLTNRYDCGDKDQAMNTIKNAFKKLSSSEYGGIQINIKQADMTRIKAALFQTDKEFKDLDRSSAIAKIKEERSYLNVIEFTKSFGADLIIKKVDAKDVIKTYENRQLNELLEIVENETLDKAKRYDIKIRTSKVFSDLSRDAAIEKIKEERSYLNFMRLTSSYQTDLIVKSEKCTVYENRQLNDLLKIVENNDCNSLKYDIIIKMANEGKMSSSSYNSEVKLNLVQSQLDQKSALEKLESVKADKCDLDFVLDQDSLSKLIMAHKELKFGILRSTNNQDHPSYEKIDRKRLLSQLKKSSKHKESPSYIKFDNLTLDEAKKLVQKLCDDDKKVSIAIHFKDINDFHESKCLHQGQADSFSFDNLSQEMAEKIIPILREFNFNFTLQFKDLTVKEAKYVISHADLSQEDMKITKVKKISDMYLANSAPSLELNEFISKGMEYILEINEKQFVPWRSICTVAGLATVQVIGGAVLIMTGKGLKFFRYIFL
jgi:hypothetical protein